MKGLAGAKHLVSSQKGGPTPSLLPLLLLWHHRHQSCLESETLVSE